MCVYIFVLLDTVIAKGKKYTVISWKRSCRIHEIPSCKNDLKMPLFTSLITLRVLRPFIALDRVRMWEAHLILGTRPYEG